MSGYINIYKIDPVKIKEKLYPKLINTELTEIYIPETGRTINHFKKFLEVNKNDSDYQDVSFEKIIQKLTDNDIHLTYNEFTAINDWFGWYHRDKIDTDEVVPDDYGLIEIGSLHTRFEATAFFGLGCSGIENYLFPILKPDFEWKDGYFPLHPQEVILTINYMIVLCIRISLFLKDTETEDMIKDFQPGSFPNIAQLESGAEKQLQSYLSQNEGFVYHREMEQMLEGYHIHFAYLLNSMKEDLGDYKGLLYKEDAY